MRYFLVSLFFLLPLFVNSENVQSNFGITEFSINSIYGVIYDEGCHSIISEGDDDEQDICETTVYVFMPYNTDLTILQPNIKITEGATILPASGEIVDFDYFNKNRTYLVTDKDGNTREYSVGIILLKKDEPRMLSFIFPILGKNISPRIRDYSDDLHFRVPDGTDIRNLTPNIVIPENTTISPDLETAQDFNKAVTYTITNNKGEENKTTVFVSNIDIRIDSITSDTISVRDTVTLYGHFAPNNNEIILANKGRFYDVWARKRPEVELVLENDSVIQIIIPEDVYQDKHFVKVWYKES